MTDPTATLKELFDHHPAAPFLFIGSGFSRRYLGLEDWAGLLARFCEPIKPFTYYRAKASDDLPLAASLMADDYYEWWWSSPDMEESRKTYAEHVTRKSDPLKFEISRYLSGYGLLDVQLSAYSEEISAFADITVDGIITTNWDSLIEEAFPDYKVYIGQNELLFSNPQSIAEIYKIHGSAADPKSLVLDKDDYQAFADKNPYLAAKLVTIFVEHPIVFIGYSITDPHIQSLIMSIAKCLSQDRIAAFEENLVFIQRVKDGELPSIEKTTLQSGSFSLSMMVTKLGDFTSIYQALSGRQRKVPARLLRFFKEQMYDFVQAPESVATKLAVIDYERLSEVDDIEFVVGVGVASRQEKLDALLDDTLARRGYAGVTADEIFNDSLQETSGFDPVPLLEGAYPVLSRSHRTFIPVFRYLKGAGINNAEQLEASTYEGAKKIVAKMKGQNFYLSPSYRKRFDRLFAGKNTDEIIAAATDAKDALIMIGFQPDESLDLDRLRSFLIEQKANLTKEPYLTGIRKLVCRYDKLKYGF